MPEQSSETLPSQDPGAGSIAQETSEVSEAEATLPNAAEAPAVSATAETAEELEPVRSGEPLTAPADSPSTRLTGKSAPLPRDSGSFAPVSKPEGIGSFLLNVGLAIALLYVFLVGIQCLSSGIKGLGSGVMGAEQLQGALNPMLGLLAGILATTLVQSSSVTTSLIVGIVASGELSVASAVPMIMGANIGTTVTNTIASLAHATRASEFRRAFAAATCHDFFNFLAVLTLLPLELITRAVFGVGFLERISGAIAAATVGTGGAKYHSPLKAAFKAGKGVVESGVELFLSGTGAKIALAVVGVALIFVGLTGIVKVMRRLVLTRMERYVNRFLGKGGPVGIVVGIIVTVMVQSSSITTSILVPLAGAGLMTVYQVYPITLGANLGTTITALLASLAFSGDPEQAAAGRQIAFVHLLFNVAGILVWYVPPPLRRIPPYLARRMGRFAARKKRWAVVYVAGVFYGLPALIFFVGEALGIG
jgi:sodium-dependent phosphate cotransporter